MLGSDTVHTRRFTKTSSERRAGGHTRGSPAHLRRQRTTLRSRARATKEKGPARGLKVVRHPAKWGQMAGGLEVHSTPCGEKGSRRTVVRLSPLTGHVGGRQSGKARGGRPSDSCLTGPI